jgi:GTP-binding protein YchF
VKTNDALLHVVRGFQDRGVPHSEGSIDVLRDISTLDTEFLLSDMAIIETRMERLQKMMQKSNGEASKKELAILAQWYESLQNEMPLREVDLSNEEKKLVKNYQLLSAKPMLIALNLDEADAHSGNGVFEMVAQKVRGKNTGITTFSAKIEMELTHLAPEEAAAFMAEYGITESALTRLIDDAYQLLGLQSFFTVGEDECRAWTIKRGMTAQEAAGVIHSDFYNTFIRAEVVGYNDFIELGSFAKCKEKGVWRLEGKDYVVQDGDIMSIRHS